jgi:hypothetical protein
MAMRSACSLPRSDYRAMAQRCRAYVREHHDWHANAHRLGELYRHVTRKGQNRIPVGVRPLPRVVAHQ